MAKYEAEQQRLLEEAEREGRRTRAPAAGEQAARQEEASEARHAAVCQAGRRRLRPFRILICSRETRFT